MDRVKGKIAVITGVAGPKGIGYAIAKQLGREGATLAVTDVSKEVYDRAEELIALGYAVAPFQVDLIQLEAVQRMVEKIRAELGRIDILVNVAGGRVRGEARKPRSRRFIDVTEAAWDRGIAINLKTTFNCTKAVYPSMVQQQYGRIVNISSTTGPIGSFQGAYAYSAAKAAILGFTRALALDGADYGITVNAIAPGWIDTRDSAERRDGLESIIPLKRLGTAAEVANLALFLASDEASYMTGHLIIIDGGLHIPEIKT
jgi:3-oxoacyl-[acyl-carrier protein] reductase